MPVLRADDVSVRFGGLLALDSVHLEAEAGRVTGLIGPNGAGKTTIFNVITGLQAPTEGRIFIGDEDVTNRKPHKRARLRMARTFQRLEVFGSLTARENILVAAEIRNGWSKDREDPKQVTDAIIDRVGLRSVANDPVDSMPTGLARLVELGRALATQPQLLLLDEPGSGLDHNESEVLGDLLLDLAAEGMAVLLVEHDVELVMRVCEEIFVLDFGRLIAQGPPAAIQANEAVQAAYLGAENEALEEHETEDVLA
ncbi:MAG: ABC-type branched-chain amino acid transport system, ATPase component [Actinomycetia bacterium]|nr:ABC-type branched-chain amino acid transport system, ATPase component [Actinomycetes bacterium]